MLHVIVEAVLHFYCCWLYGMDNLFPPSLKEPSGPVQIGIPGSTSIILQRIIVFSPHFDSNFVMMVIVNHNDEAKS